MQFQVKKTLLALALAALSTAACATVTQTCATPDARANVFAANVDAGIANHAVQGSTCTVNDLINQDGNWGSRQSFLNNVNSVVSGLQQSGDLSTVDAAAILAAAQASDGGKFLKVKIIGLNDFHGNIQPPTGSAAHVTDKNGVKTLNVGGAAIVATWVNTLKAKNPNNAVVGVGDMINAAPFVSSLFHNEPAVVALNQIGLEFASVGNHEFDYGVTEIQRMQAGGCHPVDGCKFQSSFDGAKFQYLSANVVNRTTGQTLFPAYRIKDFKGNKVAFVGMTLRDTPTIVNPTGVANWDFKDEAATVNALVPRLRALGVSAIVVLLHQGDSHTSSSAAQYNDFNGCPDVSGALDEVVNRLSPYVDLVLSAHTHQAYVCTLNGKLVTQAGHYGRFVSEIDLTLDTATRKVVTKSASNIPTASANVTPDPVVAQTVADAVAASTAADRPAGTVTAPIYKDGNYQNESALGDVLADAMLWATADAAKGGAVAAFMNPGGIRADLTPANNQVMFSNLFNIQPFTNYLTTETLTGAQIKELLEEQFGGYVSYDVTGKKVIQAYDKVLQVAGITYSWSKSAPLGSKVDVNSIKIQGQPLDLNASYNIVVNNFMAAGGDSFSVLTKGTNIRTGDVDVTATEAYFNSHSPVAPGAKNRITQLP